MSESSKQERSQWFAVRCVFASPENKPWGPTDLRSDEVDYEERITLWEASNHEEAIELAEAEGSDYATDVGARYLGLAQSFSLANSPEHGEEVFSLIRRSSLPPDQYLSVFFDSGSERQE